MSYRHSAKNKLAPHYTSVTLAVIGLDYSGQKGLTTPTNDEGNLKDNNYKLSGKFCKWPKRILDL